MPAKIGDLPTLKCMKVSLRWFCAFFPFINHWKPPAVPGLMNSWIRTTGTLGTHWWWREVTCVYEGFKYLSGGDLLKTMYLFTVLYLQIRGFPCLMGPHLWCFPSFVGNTFTVFPVFWWFESLNPLVLHGTGASTMSGHTQLSSGQRFSCLGSLTTDFPDGQLELLEGSGLFLQRLTHRTDLIEDDYWDHHPTRHTNLKQSQA